MLNLYKISIIECDCNNYTDFVVVAKDVKDVLELIYHKVCFVGDGETYYKDIPYCLRSSNMRIENLGTFEPADNWNKNQIISCGWNNA